MLIKIYKNQSKIDISLTNLYKVSMKNRNVPYLVRRWRLSGTGATSVPEEGATDFPAGGTPPEEAESPVGAAADITIPASLTGIGARTGMGAGGGPEAPTFPFPLASRFEERLA
jgi:hypothetical protein